MFIAAINTRRFGWSDVSDILIYLDILRGHLNASREEILKIEINFFDGGYGVFFSFFVF
jgi:hypothetical protein